MITILDELIDEVDGHTAGRLRHIKTCIALQRYKPVMCFLNELYTHPRFADIFESVCIEVLMEDGSRNP